MNGELVTVRDDLLKAMEYVSLADDLFRNAMDTQIDYGLDHRSSSVLLGQCVRYEVGNVFDPAYTMVARMDKRFLPRRQR